MRKLLIIAFLILLPLHAYAIIIGGDESVVSICTTTADASVTGDEYNASAGIGLYDTQIWKATKFTVNSPYNACSVKVQFSQTGTPTSTLTACIYTESAGVPDVLVGSCSTAINESAIIDAGLIYTFPISAALSIGDYRIVLKRGTPNSSNYLSWHNKSGYCAGCMSNYNSTTTTWTSSINIQGEYVVYK